MGNGDRRKQNAEEQPRAELLLTVRGGKGAICVDYMLKVPKGAQSVLCEYLWGTRSKGHIYFGVIGAALSG